MFYAWVVRRYKWCAACQKKAAQPKSELCPTCIAELDLLIEKMLTEGQS